MAEPQRPPAKNDASSKIAGIEYQKLLGLEACLNAPGDDAVLYLEAYGDISIDGTSKEVKHHYGDKAKLADASIDFWKTLDNWVKEWETIYRQHTILCLSTTADLPNPSIFYRWNDLDASERLTNLKTVQSNKTIEDHYKNVFKQSEKRILEILGRIQIRTGEIGVSALWQRLQVNQALALVPVEHREKIIKLLIGYS